MSPRYDATMLCDPTDSKDVEYVAVPADSVPLPRIVGCVVSV